MRNPIVLFKSLDAYYVKEKNGKKPNTVRQIDVHDTRFDYLRDGKAKTIRIQHADKPHEFFDRKVTDYTEWHGLAIISWKVQK